MAPLRPPIRIRVVDPAGLIIPNAIVTATAAAFPGGTAVGYDSYWNVFANSALSAGPCTLTVAASGFLTQTRSVVFVDDSIETFVLARQPGARRLTWYYRGFVPVPFDLPHMIGVAMAPTHQQDIDAVRMLPVQSGLHPTPFSEPLVDDGVHGQRVWVFMVPNDDAALGGEFERRVRALPSVRAVGTVVRFAPNAVSFVTNEIVVALKPGAPMPDLVAYGLEVIRPIPWLDNAFVLRGNDASFRLLDTTDRLTKEDAVRWAEPNVFSTIVWHSNDALYPVQPHHPLIDTPGAWALPNGKGERSRIAVLDNGCDTAHPDLSPRIVASFNFDAPTSAVTIGLDGHGTRASGIAAAQIDNVIGIAGVAGMAGLAAIQIGGAMDLDYAEMFIWCAGLAGAPNAAGPSLSPGADVLSNSWGVTGLAAGALSTTPWMGGLMAAVFWYLEHFGRNNRGTVIVFSAGNEDTDFALLYPWAAYPTNLAVGASTTTTPEQRVPNSNYGVELDVCAPGGGAPPGMQATTSTDAAALSGMPYNDFGETSCACPQVAGAAALILSVNPELSAARVRDALRATASKIDNPSVTGSPLAQYIGPSASPWRFSLFYGYGRIRAGTATRQMLTGRPGRWR